MLSVDENVKELLDRQFRNPCHFKVILGIIEPTAVENSTLSANDNVYFSELNSIESNKTVTGQYATLEDYFTPLNGEKELPRNPGEGQLYQGYVSDVMSDENGNYRRIPMVTITTSTPIQVIGLTMDFDNISKDYPTELRFTTYLDDTQAEQFITNPTSWSYILEHNFTYFDKLTIEFLKSNMPYRRARFTHIMYGINRTYDTTNKGDYNNLVNVTEEKEISLVNKNLPIFDMSFSINNLSGRFDTDNPTGIDKYVVENQPVTYYWGIENDNGDVKWMLGGSLLTDGSLTANNKQVTIKTTDQLTKLEDTFIKGLYRPDGITLYDLAVEVLTDAGLNSEDYILDSSLSNFRTLAPLPSTTHKACLQLIASAACCVLFSDREGRICIRPLSTSTESYYLDLNKTLNEPPKTTMIQLMKNMTSYYYTFTVSSTISEIASLETNLQGTETLQLEYEDARDVSATVTGGTLVSANYYTKYCELTVTANGNIKIKVNGKSIKTTSTLVDKSFGSVGKTAETTNPLICTYEHCIQYIDFVANAIENRNVYESSFRGDPTLDVGDKITTETKFSTDMPSIITKTKIDFKGSFTGDIKFVKQNT